MSPRTQVGTFDRESAPAVADFDKRDLERFGVAAIWKAEGDKEAEGRLRSAWLAQAQPAELERWCLKCWNDLTDEVGEVRHRRAGRHLQSEPLPLGALSKPDSRGRRYVLAERAAYEEWIRETATEPGKSEEWSNATWRVFRAELTPAEAIAVDLKSDGHSGREIAEMVGCSEGMIRKRLLAAAGKLWFALWVALDPYDKFAAASTVRTPPRGIRSPTPRPPEARWPDARPLALCS